MRTPAPTLLAESLQFMSAKLAEMDRVGLVKALSAMGVYNSKLLLASVSLLGTEVVPSDADEFAQRWSERACFCRRLRGLLF